MRSRDIITSHDQFTTKIRQNKNDSKQNIYINKQDLN